MRGVVPSSGEGTSGSTDVRVLHVDDDSAFADVTAASLERERRSLTVETATDADEAMTRLRTGDVDCVVTDYEMATCDGLALLRRVRAEYESLPIFMFSSRDNDALVTEALDAEATDFIRKRFDANQFVLLANRIENAVARRRAERERRNAYAALEAAREGIALLDSNGRFAHVDGTYADAFGYDSDALVGVHWETLYGEADATELRDEVFPTVRSRGRWRGVVVGERKDGASFRGDHTLVTTESGGWVWKIRSLATLERGVRESVEP